MKDTQWYFNLVNLPSVKVNMTLFYAAKCPLHWLVWIFCEQLHQQWTPGKLPISQTTLVVVLLCPFPIKLLVAVQTGKASGRMIMGEKWNLLSKNLCLCILRDLKYLFQQQLFSKRRGHNQSTQNNQNIHIYYFGGESFLILHGLSMSEAQKVSVFSIKLLIALTW